MRSLDSLKRSRPTSLRCPLEPRWGDRIGFAGPSVIVAAAGAVRALLGWIVLAALTYIVGTQILAEPTTRAHVPHLMRTLGFAQSPSIARVLGAIPLVGPLVLGLVTLWMFVAMVLALRQALDHTSTTRAVIVCLAGWLLSIVAYLLVLEIVEGGLETLLITRSCGA